MQANAADPKSGSSPKATGRAATGAFFTGALGVGMLASCCGVPLVLSAIGLGTSGAALAFSEWRYPLLAICVGSMLGSGIYMLRRQTAACETGCSENTVRRSQTLILVGVALSLSLGAVGILLARPSSASPPPPNPLAAASTIGAQEAWVEVPVRGLSCASCSGPIRTALNAVAPIERFDVDIPNGLVRFSVAEDKIDMAAFRRAIEGLGYATDKARLIAAR